MSIAPPTTVQLRNNVISDRMKEIAPSGIRKFFDLLASLDDVISLGVGEPDFPTPWHIREAAIYSLEHGQTMYTSNMGMPELRQELSRYLANTYDLDYDWNNELLISVGVSEGMDLAMRAILNPGDEVILPDPCYVSYGPCVTFAGGKPIPICTYPESGFTLDPSDVEDNITPRTKAILIGFPSNPTGAVMGRKDLLCLAKIAMDHDLIVISDEIYSQLVYGVEHTCFATLPGMKERTIFLGGFSKAYAMTGWRVGYAASTPEIIEAMGRIHQYTMLCAPIMGQVAAIEALMSGSEAVQQMVEEYDHRRRVIVKGLNDIGLPCFEPKGAFYAFPSVKGTGLLADEFAEKLLLNEKVAVVAGSAFGKCGKDHVRCCYATSLADIEEALIRMDRFVRKLR